MATTGTHGDTLYIVGDLSSATASALISSASEHLSVVLIEKAVTATNVPAASVRVLEHDLHRHKATSAYPSVTYSELLDMIFEAKRVAVL
jgi:hypothetical protein